MPSKRQTTIHFMPRNTETIGSSRLRVFAVAKRLPELGFPCKIYDPPSLYTKWDITARRFRELWRNIRLLYRISKNRDILFGQKIHSQPDFAYLVIFFKKIFGLHFIFDFDDAIFDRRLWRTNTLIRVADRVIVGGEYLKSYALQFNDRITVVATSYDPQIYDIAKYSKNEPMDTVTIGWIGYGTHHRDNLKLLIEPFTRLAKRYKLRFVCIGVLGDPSIIEMFSSIDNLEFVRVDEIDWVDERVAAAEIYTFDIGVMPLLDTVRAQGSCGGKALQYMLLAVATVASPVGEIQHIIDDGTNGFIANSADEWTQKLTALIENPKLRKSMGESARKTLLAKCNIDTNIHLIKESIEDIIRRKS